MKQNNTCIICIFTFIIGVSVFANDSDSLAQLNLLKAQLQKDIAQIDEKIRFNDSLIRKDKERFELLQKRALNDIENKETEILGLEGKVDTLQNEIERLSGSIESIKAQERAIIAQRSYLSDQLIQHCQNLKNGVAKSLPWDKEKRIARITALKKDLETGSAQIEDGLSRLLSLINEEISFGDDIVLEERTVQRNDGSSVIAQMLRLGNLWIAYVDKNKNSYGILSRQNDTSFAWREELSFSEREEVRTAIRVKESKKAPQLTPLTVDLQVRTEGVTDEE